MIIAILSRKRLMRFPLRFRSVRKADHEGIKRFKIENTDMDLLNRRSPKKHFGTPISYNRIFSLLITALSILPPASSSYASLPATAQKTYFKLFGDETATEDAAIIRNLELFIKENPGYSDAYRNLIDKCIFFDRTGEGKNFFHDLVRENPNRPDAYYALGRLYFHEKDQDSAKVYMKRCIELDPGYSYAYGPYGGLVDIFEAGGDLDGAESFLKSLLDSNDGNPCPYYGLGRLYSKRYEWERSLHMLNKALELDSTFVLAYHSLLYVYGTMGRYDEVEECGKKFLQAALAHNDFDMASYALIRIGGCYDEYGDYSKALEYYSRALHTARKIGSWRRQGDAYGNIAVSYAMLGFHEKALRYFQKTLDLDRKRNSRQSEVRALQNIATVYKILGLTNGDDGMLLKSTESYEQALKLAREMGLREEECVIIGNLGNLYQNWGDYKTAEESYNTALEIARSIGSKHQEAYALRSLGSLNLDNGDVDKAIGYLELAATIGSETHDLQTQWEAQSGLGKCFMEKKLWKEAIKRFRRAIALYDRVRGNLDIVSLSVNFLDDKYEAFPRIIQALAHVGRLREAYIFAEKYKAKGLMDTISEGWLRIQELVPDSIKNAVEEVQGKIEVARRELHKSEQTNDPDKTSILSLEQEITELEFERVALLNRLKTKSGNYYQWMLSEPLSIEAIQREILEPDDVIIEYVQGPEDLLVFLVTSDTLHFMELPVTRTEIDSMMRMMSPIFEWRKIKQKAPIDFPIGLQRGFSVHAAAELYDTLIRPIKRWIPEKGELIISPDDVLYYLPFEVLVADTGKMVHPQDYKRIRYLLSEHPLSYTPAASLLKLLMQKRRTPERGLLALGNPDFDSIEKNTTIRESPGGKSMFFLNLPNSEKEVFDLKSIVPFDRNTVRVGKNASEHLLKSEAGRYSIIHFATHFIIEEDRPLYSRIVLSAGDGEDGLLNAYEVYSLTFNADLVVLGGCESGVGTLHRGEGFIGLSRAFFYSGAKSILLSLWAVDDEATSTIMKDFYRALRSGMGKSEALRKAKLDYLSISDEERCDPFYWAPFVLLGQKDQIDFPNSKIRTVAIYLLIGMVSVSSLAVIFHTARKNGSNRFTIIRSGDRSQTSDS